MEEAFIRVHSIPQEYWYLSRTPCDCGGKLETTHQELVEKDSVPTDRLTVKCDNCGRERAFSFDVSAFVGSGAPSSMEQIVKFVNQLSNDGDVLGVDFLQEILDTARSSMSSHVHNGVLHEFGGLDGVEDRLAAEEASALLQLAKQGDAEAQWA